MLPTRFHLGLAPLLSSIPLLISAVLLRTSSAGLDWTCNSSDSPSLLQHAHNLPSASPAVGLLGASSSSSAASRKIYASTTPVNEITNMNNFVVQIEIKKTWPRINRKCNGASIRNRWLFQDEVYIHLLVDRDGIPVLDELGRQREVYIKPPAYEKDDFLYFVTYQGCFRDLFDTTNRMQASRRDTGWVDLRGNDRYVRVKRWVNGNEILLGQASDLYVLYGVGQKAEGSMAIVKVPVPPGFDSSNANLVNKYPAAQLYTTRSPTDDTTVKNGQSFSIFGFQRNMLSFRLMQWQLFFYKSQTGETFYPAVGASMTVYPGELRTVPNCEQGTEDLGAPIVFQDGSMKLFGISAGTACLPEKDPQQAPVSIAWTIASTRDWICDLCELCNDACPEPSEKFVRQIYETFDDGDLYEPSILSESGQTGETHQLLMGHSQQSGFLSESLRQIGKIIEEEK